MDNFLVSSALKWFTRLERIVFLPVSSVALSYARIGEDPFVHDPYTALKPMQNALLLGLCVVVFSLSTRQVVYSVVA